MRYLQIVFIALTCCLLPWISVAQPVNGNRATLFLTVKTPDGQPVKQTRVWVTEQKSGLKIEGATDRRGQVQLKVGTGYIYTIGMPGADAMETVDFTDNSRLQIIRTIVFAGQPANPGSAVMDTVRQKIGENQAPGTGQGRIDIKLLNEKQLPYVAKVDVKLICKALGTVYVAAVDKGGKARLMVPINQKYRLAIDNDDNLKVIEMPDEEGGVMNYSLTYVPTRIQETLKNDTVRQQVTAANGPTTARAFVKILVTDPDGNPLDKEPVYFREENGTRVFTSTTGTDGMAYVMLPKGINFVVGFKYEGYVDLHKVPANNYLHSTSIEYSYLGSVNIENFHNSANLDANGNRKDFMPVKVTPIANLKTFNKNTTSYGFDMKLAADNALIASPAIMGQLMFTSLGFYSNEIYGIDYTSGKPVWGTALGEGGASSMVMSGDKLFVTTESCTIYVLDMKSGKLLWSAWLSDFLYSTPSVSGNSVYAVYEDIFSFSQNGKDPLKHVVVCFDLNTGKPKWQTRISEDAIGSPVIAGNKVYVTTRNGKLEILDAANGKSVKTLNASAVSTPLITKDKIYLCRNKGPAGQAGVSAYRVADQSEIFTFNAPKFEDKGADVGKLYPCYSMNHNGPKPVSYKGKLYFTTVNSLVCADMETGKQIWAMPVDTFRKDYSLPSATMPVIAGDRVIVCTQSGKVLLFDPSTGNLQKEYNAGKAVWSQPSVADGWIYVGTLDGQMVSINTKDKSITGWPMWNRDATHNTVIE